MWNILAINQFNVTNIAQNINYYVNANVNSNNILFEMNAQNMNWSYLSVNFWISSRNDLSSGVLTFCKIVWTYL